MKDTKPRRKETAPNPDETTGWSALYSGILESTSHAQTAVASLESKGNAIFTTTLAVITFLASIPSAQSAWTIYGMALLSLSALSSLGVSGVAQYFTPVRHIEENDEYIGMKADKLLLHLIADAQDANRQALANVETKRIFYIWTVRTFILGIAVSVFLKIVPLV